MGTTKTNRSVNATLCQAGNFQFAPDQVVGSPCIQSRGWLWCKSGRGEVTVNGQVIKLEAANLWLLPWNRRVSFRSSSQEPLFIGMVHVVPAYLTEDAPVFSVAHRSTDPLFDSAARRDAELVGLSELDSIHLNPGTPLAHLLNYAIAWFQRGERDLTSAREIADILIRETATAFSSKQPASGALPPLLQRALIYIDRCYKDSPTVEEIARVLQRSESYLLKLFRRHLNTTVKAYILDTQISAACQYLSSSHLNVAEIGQRVGIPDPYHFSRVFRRRKNCTPTQYRETFSAT